MATVFDVAAYILKQKGSVTAMKLQKLVYYSQAWGLVWDEEPLFESSIEAWANGPVIPDLYREHQGQFKVSSISQGSSDNLSDDQKETIDKVLEFYGDKSAHYLSDLTHAEEPWKQAREGVMPGHRSSNKITLASMAEYYDSL